MEYLIFNRSGFCLGIEIEHIRQVVNDVTVAPVPLSPPGYAGLIYHRGELFEVADLGVINGKENATESVRNLNILLKWNQKGIALTADKIIGLRSMEEGDNELESSTLEGKPIKIITPERVWKMLSELSYGPRQI